MGDTKPHWAVRNLDVIFIGAAMLILIVMTLFGDDSGFSCSIRIDSNSTVETTQPAAEPVIIEGDAQ